MEAQNRVKKHGIERRLENLIQKLQGRRYLKPIEAVLRGLQTIVYGFNRRDAAFSWEETHLNVQAILYDIYAEKKEEVSEIIEHFQNVTKFSLNHGLKLKNINYYKGKQPALRRDVISYIQNPDEADHEKDRFGIPYANQKVVGVPRHEKEWMDTLIEHEDGSLTDLGRDFIFLISRPHTTEYHPPDRKKRALEHIRRLAWEDLDKKIVIKLHPKENDRDIFNEVFGLENYRNKWEFSNKHPLILGSRCDFAIALFSGVVIDMIALGVSPIELLDLRGIPRYDHESALRDERGNPVFELRYNGLTLGACNYKELREEVDRIQTDRDEVLSVLKKKYDQYYQTKRGVNDRIAREIISETKSHLKNS
jgi:hypothetical protein